MAKKNLIFACLAISLHVGFAANWCGLASCQGAQHIDCKMGNGAFGAACPSSAVMLNLEPGKDIILDKINSFRNAVAVGGVAELPPAARMGMLRWNVTLANLCRKNVKQCTVPPADFGYDGCRNTPDFDFVGQNQAYAIVPAGDTRSNFDIILGLIDLWHNQCAAVSASDIAKFPGSTGAKGQLIASCTQSLKGYATRVGCGALIWTNNDNSKMLKLCCNYDSGNYVGYPIYDIGTPASRCVTGRDSKYRNLCSANERYNVNQFQNDYQ